MYSEINLLGVGLLVLVFVTLLVISRSGRTSSSYPSKKSSQKDERRAYARYKIPLRIKYKTPAEEGTSWIRDISEGGAQIFLNKTLKSMGIGESLELEIDLPSSSESILVHGNIVWSKEDNAGLSFEKLEQGDMKNILEYIKAKEAV